MRDRQNCQSGGALDDVLFGSHGKPDALQKGIFWRMGYICNFPDYYKCFTQMKTQG